MTIGDGDFRYDFHDFYLDPLPDAPHPGGGSGRTHGVAVLDGGDLLLFRQGSPAVLRYSPQGELKASFGDFAGAHGLEVVKEDGREVLWVTDEVSCKVQKLSLDGEVLMDLPSPPSDETIGGEEPARQRYVPTWATVAPSGDVFVGDGYGSHFVFRFGPDGTYKGKLTGEEGAGRFNEPHSVRFSPDGELFITDRSTRRVTVYDADGRYLRHSDTACHSPADFAFGGGHVYVAEILGEVKVLDAELNVLAALGTNQGRHFPSPDEPAGWYPGPDGGYPDVPRDTLEVGQFHTPHGIAVAPNGDIYVGEWYEGGRVIKLEKK